MSSINFSNMPERNRLIDGSHFREVPKASDSVLTSSSARVIIALFPLGLNVPTL